MPDLIRYLNFISIRVSPDTCLFSMPDGAAYKASYYFLVRSRPKIKVLSDW